MATSIGKLSKSFFVKVLVGIIILPFVFWGMGDVFRGGNQNIIVTIDSEKISTQEFSAYLNRLSLSEKEISNISKSDLLEKILNDYIGKKIIDLETKNLAINVSDTSLKNIIINDKTFFKDKKFSRTEYEKFLLKSAITAPMFEQNIVAQEKKRQLLSFLSDGAKIPEFLIDIEFNKENQTRSIKYLDLNTLYKNRIVKKSEIEDVYNKNKGIFIENYKSFLFTELTPEKLIGQTDYNEDFFNKIDEIENNILDGRSIKEISDEYSLQLTKTEEVDKRKKNINGVQNQSIEKILFSKMFVIEKLNLPELIIIDSKYYLCEINSISKKDLSIENKEVLESIKAQLQIKFKLVNNTEIVEKITSGSFNFEAMKQYAKEQNLKIISTQVKNVDDNKIFTKELVKRIFSSEDKQVILVTDSRLSDNFIIFTENIKYQNIERNTKKYEEFKAKAKINFAGEIYSTYDKRINAKYNIDINNKAVDRIKNSF